MNDTVKQNRVFFIPNHPDVIMSKELERVYCEAINDSLALQELPVITRQDPTIRLTIDVSTHERDLQQSIDVLKDFEGVVLLNFTYPAREQVQMGNLDTEPMRWSSAFNTDMVGELFRKLNSFPAKAFLWHGSFSVASLSFYSRGVLITVAPTVVDLRKR